MSKRTDDLEAVAAEELQDRDGIAQGTMGLGRFAVRGGCDA